jgi:hypothetical protein
MPSVSCFPSLHRPPSLPRFYCPKYTTLHRLVNHISLARKAVKSPQVHNIASLSPQPGTVFERATELSTHRRTAAPPHHCRRELRADDPRRPRSERIRQNQRTATKSASPRPRTEELTTPRDPLHPSNSSNAPPLSLPLRCRFRAVHESNPCRALDRFSFKCIILKRVRG